MKKTNHFSPSSSEEARNIADAIVKLRVERRLTQGDLAMALGISPSTVSTWESGDRSPNRASRQQLCDYFNVDMNYLFGYSQVQNSSSIDSDNCVSIALYDRYCISKDKKLSDIFDKKALISNMMLPKMMFNRNKHFFSIVADDNSLINNNIKADDILIFSYENRDDIANNKIVCALVKNKVVVKKYEVGKGNNFKLKDNKDSIELNDSKGPVIIGQLISVISDYQ